MKRLPFYDPTPIKGVPWMGYGVNEMSRVFYPIFLLYCIAPFLIMLMLLIFIFFDEKNRSFQWLQKYCQLCCKNCSSLSVLCKVIKRLCFFNVRVKTNLTNNNHHTSDDPSFKGCPILTLQDAEAFSKICFSCSLCSYKQQTCLAYYLYLQKCCNLFVCFLLLSGFIGIFNMCFTFSMQSLPITSSLPIHSRDKVLDYLQRWVAEWSVSLYLISYFMLCSVLLWECHHEKKYCQNTKMGRRSEELSIKLTKFLTWVCVILFPGFAEFMTLLFFIVNQPKETIPPCIIWRAFGALFWLLLLMITFILHKDYKKLQIEIYQCRKNAINCTYDTTIHADESHESFENISLAISNSNMSFEKVLTCNCHCRFKKFCLIISKEKPSPFLNASYLSRLCFSWIGSFLALGYSRSIEQSDLYALIPSQCTQNVETQLNNLWQEEISSKGKNASLFKVCFLWSRSLLLETFILKFSYDTLKFTNPFFIKYFVNLLDYAIQNLYPKNDTLNTTSTNGLGALFVKGVLVILLMFLSNSIQTLILQRYFYLLFMKGLQMRTALISIVYNKLLKSSIECVNDSFHHSNNLKHSKILNLLKKMTSFFSSCYVKDSHSKKSLKNSNKALYDTKASSKNDTILLTTNVISVGNVVNLISVDAQRIYDCFSYLHILWSGIYQIVLVLIFLWFEMGHAMWTGLAVMLMGIPLTGFITRRLKACQKTLMVQRDERVKMTSEVFSLIKIIKLYAWEKSFEREISLKRSKELLHLRSYILLTICQQILWMGIPVIVTLVVFLTFVLLGNTLTAAKAFTAITLFQYLAFPLGVFPNSFSSTLEAYIALNRIQDFLERLELPPPRVLTKVTNKTLPTIIAKNLCLSWPNGSTLLKNATFECYPGKVTAVIGQTGVGKSGLLLSLIQEILPQDYSTTPSSNKSLSVLGRVAYVSQVSWIQNLTLRDNILFGSTYDKDIYDEIIHACCLIDDIKMLPNGDLTEIGEHGVTLSGGQKQRVALARAVYQGFITSDDDTIPADVFLLDDCLSAVDANVGEHIFRNCILGILKKNFKTVLLVTHKVEILPFVDQIILLDNRVFDVDGTRKKLGAFIVCSGTHEELKKKNIPLYNQLTHVLSSSNDFKYSYQNNDRFLDKSLITYPNVTKDDTVNKINVLSENNDNNKEITQMNEAQRTAAGILIQEEKVFHGSNKYKIYFSYFSLIGGIPLIILLIVALIGGRGTEVFSRFWLSYWSDHRDTIPGLPTGILVFFCLSCIQILFFFFFFLVFGLASIKGSFRIHSSLVSNLLRAPMSFFNSTPLSRILSRFSKDINVLDQSLQGTLGMYGKQLAIVTSTFLLISIAAPWFSPFCLILTFVYITIQHYYIPTSRQLQRIDSVLKSPVSAHMSMTLSGLPTIRAFQFQNRLQKENRKRIDSQQKAITLLIFSNRWLATRLEFLGTLTVTFASTFVLFQALNNSISSGLVGLLISDALNITQSLNWMVRMASECETNSVSVERLYQYLNDIPQEECNAPLDNKVDSTWPSKGSIQFVKFSVRYRHDLPFVLKNLNFTINAGEKVGVVGRTGAGKSSLLLALMRLIEASEGQIFVDNVDIAKISLHKLRSSFSIIPQDPVLFNGSLKFNLDPFNLYSDEKLWFCLERANLKNFVVNQFPGGLDGGIEENGQNISQGQRQLICLCRALLRDSAILLLDEATSAVDSVTDNLIQQTVRIAFKNSTVLTIAHRLSTILDYDRILVLQDGRIVEFDTPSRLLIPSITPSQIFRSLFEKDRKIHQQRE